MSLRSLTIHFFSIIIFAVSILWQVATAAIPVVVEIEPNNTPKQALDFSAPVILSGSMSGGDQDAFLWHISDADALKLWDMTLHGIPGALTGVSIVRVKYDQDPNDKDASKPAVILGTENILTFGIRDGSRPVHRKNMFFPAGDYIVGLFQTGTKKDFQPPSPKSAIKGTDSKTTLKETDTPNAYRLQIKQGLGVSYSFSKPHGTKKTAFKLNAGGSDNSLASVLGGESWYSIKINEKQSKLLFSIKGEIMLERKLTMSLYNEKGAEIAKAKSDQYGHYTLPNLALEEGQYFVKLKDKNKEPATRNIRIIETGVVTKDSELEPNGDWIHANIIDLNEPLKAKADKKSETDYFKFITTDENQNGFNLTLDSPNIDYIYFCLLNSKGTSRSCRKEKPPLVFTSLNLNTGTHGLLVSRSTKIGDYTITKSDTGTTKKNIELEPNDKPIDASVFGKKGLIRGTLDKQDIDYFTLNVTAEPQLWRLQAIGSNLGVLKYHPQKGGSGASVKASSKAKRLRLDNLYLLPGAHQFSLTSRVSTKYVLRALPLGSPSPDVEREPNNKRDTAQKMAVSTDLEPNDIKPEQSKLPVTALVYLNNQNINVTVGVGTAAGTFNNTYSGKSTVDKVIDASSADAEEKHNQTSHFWFTADQVGGGLELRFDFNQEYDITSLHFWNYTKEGYDVDNIDFTFFNSTNDQVGTVSVSPALGSSPGIQAEDILLKAPINVQFVTAFLTGSNRQVDFQNIGFTAEISQTPSAITTTEFKAPPKPGFLEVVSNSKKKSATTVKLPAPTIEVILDASGSMFSEMGKIRRYQVARNVLIDLVSKQLPDNANFGLRVFGHKETGSCRTDLEIPIKRLNRKKAIQKIKKIAPKSYAKTPIAASLLATVKDLKNIKGEKIVLLITDGKETCDGDPEKAIAKLNESGIDAKVNIIGFAINNDALEAKFRRWAKAGNGEYQQALDSDALLKSIKKLSARKFTVIEADGEIQGTYYTNGKPIELPTGEYKVDFGNGLIKKITIKQDKIFTIKAGK